MRLRPKKRISGTTATHTAHYVTFTINNARQTAVQPLSLQREQAASREFREATR